MDLAGVDVFLLSRCVQDVMDGMLDSIEEGGDQSTMYTETNDEIREENSGEEKNSVEEGTLEKCTEMKVKINENEKRIVLRTRADEKKSEEVVDGKEGANNKSENSEETNRKRKMGGRTMECKLHFSSSSDESIVIIDSPNAHSIFSSPLSFSGGSGYGGSGGSGNGAKDVISPKHKCQRFRRCEDLLPVCVMRPMIGPQLPHVSTIMCPPAKVAGLEGMRRMRRMAMKKKVEELVACKMMLQKSVQLRRKEMQAGEEEVAKFKECVEKKMVELKLLWTECLQSASSALRLITTFNNSFALNVE